MMGVVRVMAGGESESYDATDDGWLVVLVAVIIMMMTMMTTRAKRRW